MIGLAALALWAGPWSATAEEDPLQEEVLSTDGETLAQSQAKAEAAAAQSKMSVTVSAVGFDIAPGSDAEKYLKSTAQAGGGSYFTANDAGQLAQAMGAAASGQSSTGTTAVDAVTLTKPTEGETVGPSLDISCKTAPGALVVIYTIAYPWLTDEKPQLVPGTRQRAKETGDFSFRIATPRVSFGETKAQVRYAIHAYVLRADGTKGPETVVNCYSPKP
jgi:hypothetical protein